MEKEQQMFAYTKEQLKTLQDYFLEKPAKESIPLLNVLGAGLAVTVTQENKTTDPSQLTLLEEKEPGGEDVPEVVMTPV